MSRAINQQPRAFRQLTIPRSQLQEGVFGPSNELVPWGALATLHLDAGELQERLGIAFSDSHDDLDYLKVALLELPSAQRVALIEHRHAPVSGTEVHGDAEHPLAAARLLAEVRDTLGLAEDDVAWQRYG